MKTKALRLLSLALTVVICIGMLMGAGGVFAAENTYIAVTERGNYASGVLVVIDAEIKLIGGHEYSLDIDIASNAPKAQTLRVMVENDGLVNLTTGTHSDAGAKRGLTVNEGWNEFRDLKFTAKATSRFLVKVHSDTFGTEDFFIDNLRIYDLTDKKEVISFDFEDEKEINSCVGIGKYGATQVVGKMKGALPEYIAPEAPIVEDLDRVTTPDEYYAAITDRASYASGVVITPGIVMEKKNYYRVDLNIYVVEPKQSLRIMVETVNGGDATDESGIDICAQRGFRLEQGWNTMTNLTFTAGSNEEFRIKIHSDTEGTSDFYLDNIYIRNVSAKEDLLYLDFDEGEDLRLLSGVVFSGASQRISVKGIELPKWSPEDELQYDIKGIVINEDFDSLSSMGESTTEESIRNFVRSWAGSHVTDYMLNIYSQIPSYPSQVATDLLDKYDRTEEQGTAVDYKTVGDVKGAKIMFGDKKIDYIKIMMDELPKVGINPWLSFRMNDAHNVSSMPTMFHFSDFFYEHPEYRRILHGSATNSYYDGLLDYSHKDVREYMLAILNEALSLYDCYGVELDFQREIWLWHTGGEYAGLDLLSEFMREFNRIVSIYEAKYGHDIKVAIRCASDIQTNYDFGLDVITWASEGLIDLVNPTGRFTTTDFDVPVRLWASVMHPYGVEVAPGLETLTLGGGLDGNSDSDLTTAIAAAANWYAQGADKIYLYNHFLRCGTKGFSESDRTDIDFSVTSLNTTKGKWNAMITLGSYEKVMSMDRRMILAYNDTKQTWKESNNPLPARVSPNSPPVAIRMPVGIIPEGAEALLNIAVNSLNIKNYPNVTVNGIKAEYIGQYAEENEYIKGYPILSYKIPASAYDDMYLIVEICSATNKYLAVPYVEALINVAD